MPGDGSPVPGTPGTGERRCGAAPEAYRESWDRSREAPVEAEVVSAA